MQPGGVATKVASGIRRVRLNWISCAMTLLAVLGMQCGLAVQTDPAQSPLSKPLYKVAPTATFALKDEKRSKTLEMTVVWPQAPLEANAKSPAQFPLVVFSHGLGGSDEAFPFLADYLAARGYVVIRPTHADSAKYMKTPGEFIRDPRASAKKLDLRDRVQDLVFILDSLAAIEKGPLGGGGVGENILIDRARIAAAGHSAGALTTMLATGTQARALDKTVASYAAGIKSIAEPRFKAGVVISGAGISAESGLKTFRGADGLRRGYRPEDVACPEAWRRNPGLVLDFYNERRKAVREAQPNAAHLALVELERAYDVRIVTQNVDDLHERAGSRQVLHLHGEIRKARSTQNPALVTDLGDRDIHLGDRCALGSQLRPHLVWFGESVPAMDEAADLVRDADVLLVVGTSLVVYPAASLVFEARKDARRIVVNPEIPEAVAGAGFETVAKPATVGVPEVVAGLLAETTA